MSWLSFLSLSSECQHRELSAIFNGNLVLGYQSHKIPLRHVIVTSAILSSCLATVCLSSCLPRQNHSLEKQKNKKLTFFSSTILASLLKGALLTSLALVSDAFPSIPMQLFPSSSKEGLPRLQVKLLSDNATMPTRGSEHAAGFDLASAENTVVKANGRTMVKTDIAIACPPGTYGRVAPRSGLAKKKGIDVGAGVIDADYRGNVGVILFNFGDEDFEIKQGDRIAQLILEYVCMANAEQVENLASTKRGAAGFGSTGVVSTAEGNVPKKGRTVSPSREKTNNNTEEQVQ